MRTALAACACMVAFLLVATTGAAAVLVIVLAAASFLLGLAGMAIAASTLDDRRGLVLLLSVVPVLVTVGFGVLLLVLANSHLD
jgi:hypothetical protein